jgi:hypothetical protein
VRWRIRFHLQEIDLPLGRTILGRAPECPFTFDDGLVSRRHAEVHVSEEGCMLIDLNSRNGVFVNGVRLTAPHMLNPNDRIRLGRDEIVVLHGVVDELSASERPTGVKRVCPCGHEHVADLATCPACGLDVAASAAVAEFLAFASSERETEPRRTNEPPRAPTAPRLAAVAGGAAATDETPDRLRSGVRVAFGKRLPTQRCVNDE